MSDERFQLPSRAALICSRVLSCLGYFTSVARNFAGQRVVLLSTSTLRVYRDFSAHRVPPVFNRTGGDSQDATLPMTVPKRRYRTRFKWFTGVDGPCDCGRPGQPTLRESIGVYLPQLDLISVVADLVYGPVREASSLLPPLRIPTVYVPRETSEG